MLKTIRILFILQFAFYILHSAFPQNPICPAGIYMADPTARVDKNGKMYVYGSRDESPDYYCSQRYDLLSSTDLCNWSLTENSFSTVGKTDGVPYSDASLYAPDMMYKDGTYFLYYCLSDFTGGVAVSRSPAGEFKNGQPIEGVGSIDPNVFIDDDGQAYYYWGQFAAKAARLNPDMKTIDISSVKDSVVTEKEHFFHEGSFVFKRNGIYYFVYTDISRQDRATCLGYSTSTDPLGPFKYGGVIIDNAGCDPAVWNNHGSVAEFKGKWYVFYHRSTQNSVTMRKVCVEPITFREDGSIPEVPMTSQGAGNPLKAAEKIDAGRACLMFGNVRMEMQNAEYKAPNEILAGIRNGDRAAWKYIDFGAGVKRFTVHLRAWQAGSIAVVPDYPWREPAGVLEFTAADNGQTLSCNVSGLEGVHTLWLQFYGEKDKDLFELDWIRFE
ncbi:MAG: family 43 glycosylhydrolase [Dysgonamonadaceae bacterium]|jgi:beta-xylosidase|nr:family 43 glycosylhydrolase [Dysgonamonadaceae bacterium]